MSPTREVHSDGWSVRLDLSRQVLRLEVPEVYLDWGSDGGKAAGPPLSPVLPLAAGPVSAAVLLLKAKQFDDGLYAAAELAAQEGAGRFPSKASLLRSLSTTLTAAPPDAATAAAVIHAACELGGLSVVTPEPIQGAVRSLAGDFLRDELASKPLGFYTWSEPLRAIFRQDRFLQRPLDPEPADDLAHALNRTPGASAAYDACLRLNARLTNPPKRPNIRDAGKRPPFFPPSRSHEVTLFEGLYEHRPIPDGFDLMGELIRRVRLGEIDLKPREQSGWYDHQTWSLEPLVMPDRMPERGRLELGKRYRKHLEDLFRGALALTRETHVRQAGGGRGGYRGSTQRPIRVHPGLTIEPLFSLYARRAAGYRFVRSVLEEAFGAAALNGMRRLAPDGTSEGSLAEELAWIEKLFTGAAATASRELGMPPMPPSGDGDAAARCFSAWRAALGADQDVSRDARMMVPVFFDEGRQKTKVWAFLGWRTTKVDVAYRVPPSILAVGPLRAEHSSTDSPPVLFSGDRHLFAVPVMVEVYVSRLLDQDEFRRHCDRHQSRDAILANLR